MRLISVNNNRLAAEGKNKPLGWDETVRSALRELGYLSYEAVNSYTYDVKLGTSALLSVKLDGGMSTSEKDRGASVGTDSGVCRE